MVPHFNVIIATPGRNMESEYVKSLVETITYLNNNNISYLYVNEYSSQVSAAREATAMGSTMLNIFEHRPLSGQVTYDKMFWIDSDISWTIDDFMNIYESDLDILSGVYINEKGVPMFTFDEDQVYIDSESWQNKKDILNRLLVAVQCFFFLLLRKQ